MTDLDRHRLAAILGMLGSEHAGERAAAALQAERFRKQHGMTWEELLAVPAPEPPPRRPASPPPCPPQAPQRGPHWDDTRTGAAACVVLGAPLWVGIVALAGYWVYALT